MPTDVSFRAQPQQARSRATVQRLLEISAQLLEEVGLEGFNTNLLAERAGLRVAAIYRYFPNKIAILVALAEGLRELENAWVGDLKALADFKDWRVGVARSIDGFFQGARRHKGYAALRAATWATPELRALDAEASRQSQANLAVGLTSLGVRLDAPRLAALCRVIIESSYRVMDVALLSEPEEARRLIEELKHMTINLLADYVDPPEAPAARA